MHTEHIPGFFISRAGADRNIAIAIAKILREAGCETWLQDEDFGHASFMARIAQGFADDKRIIALLSRAYQQSEYCKKEYEQVLAIDPRNLKERLLVFRIDDVAPSEHLKDLAYTDLVPVLSDVSALTRVVRVAIGVEKNQVECDFAALYRHSPQQIVHHEIEALRGFVGRDTELASLDAAMGKAGQTDSAVVALTDAGATALTGFGGVGKTFLAKYYAWRHRTDYQGLWWARGELRQTLVDDLVTLGARLIPGLDEMPDREAAARATLDHLATASSRAYPGAKPWLLIYDNVEGPDRVQGLIPQEGVRLLLTSRWSDWHDYATELPVGTFPTGTAVEFLLAHSRDKDAKAAARLAEDLGYLPLALEHARSYCWSTHLPFEQYRARLADLIKKVPRKARYPQSVFVTFDLALSRASEDAPASNQLIQLLSFYAPDAIPMTLVAAAMPDDNQREDAIRSLTDLSLIEFGESDGETVTINIHRLVQEVARTRGEVDNSQIASLCLAAILKHWPRRNDGGNPKQWPICRQLLPHALTLLQHMNTIKVNLEQVATLKTYAAYYLGAIGRFGEAEPLFRQALEICQRELGEAHLITAASNNNLASNLYDQGRYEEAEPFYRQALQIRQQALGEAHPSTAASYNNMAYNLNAQGRYQEAEPLVRRALEINRRELGKAHPDTASSYNNVAYNLEAQERYEEAEPLYRKALNVRRRELGESHPDTATSYNNVACNLDAQGCYDKAEPLHRKALNVRRRELGESHPTTADSYHNLASSLDDQRRYKEAESLYRQALKILWATLQPEHPKIKTTQAKLDALLAKLSSG